MKEIDRILRPKIHESVFIADGAKIVGDVEIGKGSSVWFNAVIRGDEGKITIGEDTNIQDNCVLHSDDGAVVEIGDGITIGHGAVIRGCRIGNNTMVGMNATLMSGAVIGEKSIIGANAFVPYNKEIPPRSIVVGAPGRVVGTVTGDAAKVNKNGVRIYKELVDRYQRREIVGYTTPSK
jgi:carbonic anhydrase/acetyltransferase-like protein (isoleucine patch superfamily)